VNKPDLQLVQPTRESIIGRAIYIRDEIQQIFDDVAHWNANRPAHDHIEADPDGTLKRRLDGINAMLAREAALQGGKEQK